MLVPFVIIAGWTYRHIHDEAANVFYRDLTRFTHNSAMESVDRQISEINGILQMVNLRASPEAVAGFIDPEVNTFNTTLATLVNSLVFFDSTVVADNEDNYRVYPGGEMENYVPSERDYYPENENEKVKGAFYSKPYKDIFTNNDHSTAYTISVSMNLFDENIKRYGIIAFDLDLIAMSQVLKHVTAPFNGNFLVASMDGIVIMDPSEKQLFRHKVPLEWMNKMTELEGDFYDEKEGKYIFYHTFSNPDWAAMTIVDAEEYDEFINSALYRLSFVILFCIIFYLVLILLFRIYMREILARFYMGVSGVTYDVKETNLENIYKKIKKNQVDLQEAQRVSGEDGLMGIGNRRKFDARLEELINSATPFHLAIIDLDNFKSINDTWGHDVGDQVLKYVSKTGKAVLEPDNDLYRFGGEELVAIFPTDRSDEVEELMECWRHTITQRQWREEGLHVSFSGGLARWQEGESAEQVLKRADSHLYTAKHQGKNQIVSSI